MSRARHFKRGGRASGGSAPDIVSGNPNVLKEAKARKRGGAVEPSPKVLKMYGGSVAKRLDRPGRKRGGGVGSDKSPLSSAHGSTGAESKPSPKDTYGGTKPD